MFSTVAAPFDILSKCVQGLQFLHIHSNTCYSGMRWYLIVVLRQKYLFVSFELFILYWGIVAQRLKHLPPM